MGPVDRRPTLPAGTELKGVGTLRRCVAVVGSLELYEGGGPDGAFLVAYSAGDLDGSLRGSWRPVDAAVCPAPGQYASHELRPATHLADALSMRKVRVPLESVVRGVLAKTLDDVSPPPLLLPQTTWILSTGEPWWPLNGSNGGTNFLVAKLLYWSIAGIDLDRCDHVPALRKFVTSPFPELDTVERFATRATVVTEDRDLAERRGERVNKPKGLAAVAGMHELKQRLYMDVVDVFRAPELYNRYGLSIPNGVLLYGPPGCGKTYVARRIAEELDAHFVEITPGGTGSPFIHETSILVRRVFEEARRKTPAVVFIDELDALVPRRSDMGGHQQYKAEEVNEFLIQLDGAGAQGVLVIAATNEPAKIDPAVLRAGRMDRILYVGPPDADARQEMITFHLAGRPRVEDLDLREVVTATDGCSASDLKLLVDDAAREALALRAPITSDILLFSAMHMAVRQQRSAF